MVFGCAPLYKLTTKRDEFGDESGQVDCQKKRGFRLPSHQEWLSAARADRGSAYQRCSEAELNAQAWWKANSDGRHHPVASRESNIWGFYDLNGNVSEWCGDHYTAEQDSEASEDQRLICGGSFRDDINHQGLSLSSYEPAAALGTDLGFRVVFDEPGS